MARYALRFLHVIDAASPPMLMMPLATPLRCRADFIELLLLIAMILLFLR